MSMIDRYKKPGGFVQLLNLLETTGKEKQEKFLKMISDENQLWESELRKRMLSMDKILSWPPETLAEILPRIQPIQLAMIVGGLTPEKAALFSKAMGFKESRQINDVLKEKKPTPGETSAGIMKLFSEVRKMIAEGLLKFDKIDPAMVVAQDIEEQLAQGIESQSDTHAPSQAKNTSQSIATPAAAIGKTVGVEMPTAAPLPPGIPPQVAEELTGLRRKLVQVTQENQKLLLDNSQLKEKLEKIRKIA